jgi:hypothetical protein
MEHQLNQKIFLQFIIYKKIISTFIGMININNNILTQMIQNQRKNVSLDKKLSYTDLRRVCKYIDTSIFGDECSLWLGYITTTKDDNGSYINFYFNKKKYSLHRLLYNNFIDDLNDSDYIKFSCPNKGKCCNINHFYTKNKTENNEIDINKDKIIIKKIIKDITVGFN